MTPTPTKPPPAPGATGGSSASADDQCHAACLAIVTAAATYRRLHLAFHDTPYRDITDARNELFARVDDLLLQLGGEERLPDLKLAPCAPEDAA